MPTISPLFDEVVKRSASDLHLAGGHPPLARVRGELVPLRDAPLDAKELEQMLVEIVTPAQRARLAADFDVEFAVAHKDAARFRVSCFFKRGGLAAAFRLIPQRVPSLAELGSPEILWRLADRRAGLVLFGGPVRAGKSTTLAAMIDHVNKTRACHVLTVEDPIEFVHEPARAQVTQREVGTHAPSLAVGLKNAARENPDVVHCSELRGAQATRLALSLAASGVLVLATVQARSVSLALEQLVGAFPTDEQRQVRGAIADCLEGVVVQQLVRTADGKGRAAVHEVLVGSEAVRALVRRGKSGELTAVMHDGQSEGMQTIDTALERLMTAARIAPETALEHANDRAAFAKVVARVRPDLVDPPV